LTEPCVSFRQYPRRVSNVCMYRKFPAMRTANKTNWSLIQ